MLGTEGYAATADTLVGSYESLAFEHVHRSTLGLYPTTPSDVLDIGAGTGRDAAALAALGHRVVAVEPTAEMRAHGQRLHATAAIVWIDDGLPDLASLQDRPASFDLVLLTAVWMHLDEDQRRHALPRVGRLLRRGGVMAMTLRHGPVPSGRRMFDVTPEETCALADAHGLDTIHRSERDGLFGRGITWSILAFRLR